MDESFRIVTENNLTRFMDRLHVETDPEQRKLFRKLLVREERWYGVKEEGLEALRRSLRDCDDRITRLRGLIDCQTAADSGILESETLMNNLLDIQQLFRDAIRKGLHGS